MKDRENEAAGRYATVIREKRTAAGLNQQQLAERLGVSRAAVAGWETGHGRPDLDLIPKLCRTIGISLGAFFGVREGLTSAERSLIMTCRSMEEDDRMAIRWQAEALAQRRREQRKDELKSKVIRIYRSELSAAAGFGGTLEGERGEAVWLLADGRTAEADEIITVNGHSMEPTYDDGDELLVAHTDRLREGEIGIFVADGEGYVKEYRKDGLYSHNPAYPVMRFHEGSDVRCIGRVIGKVRAEQWPTEAQMEMIQEMRL